MSVIIQFWMIYLIHYWVIVAGNPKKDDFYHPFWMKIKLIHNGLLLSSINSFPPKDVYTRPEL